MFLRADVSEARRGSSAWVELAARVLFGAAAILLVVPIILLLYMLMGFWFLIMNPAWPFILVPLFFAALLLGLLAPLLDRFVQIHPRLVPGITALAALGLLVTASLTSGFNVDQPMQNGVWYTLDAETNETAWTSFGERPDDPWTAQFFPGATEPVDPQSLYPMFSSNPLPPAAFKGPAEAASLPAPQMQILSDEMSGEVRILKLRLTSPRQARGMLVKVSGAPVASAAVNGYRQSHAAWPAQKDWYLRFYGMTDQGIDLTLEVHGTNPISLSLTDQSDGLPELTGLNVSPRTPDMMPFAMPQEYMPFPETTSVRMTYEIR
jgi:hypothetical protein